MPTISFNKKDLFELIGKKFSNDEITNLINSFKSNIEEISEEEIKVELTADRCDMFSIEGFARAIKNFLSLDIKKLNVNESDVEVHKSYVEARPFIACALIKNVKLNDYLIKYLMNLQEILNNTIGRKRKKVAIGLHDLDKIEGKILYREAEKNEKFIPLEYKEELTLEETLTKTEKGREFSYIIQSFNKFPVFSDSLGIFSFPPILNSERTKINENTKNIFIDVTGIEKNAVEQTLLILILTFLERGAEINSVKIIENGEVKLSPFIKEKSLAINKKYFEKILGVKFSEEEIISLLKKFEYEVSINNKFFLVKIPFYRFDVFSEIDIAEDLAIAYGYNNFEPELPNVFTEGKINPIEKVKSEIEELLIGLGFLEVITPTLTNSETQFKKMLLEEDDKIVKIENPISNLYTQLRIWLIPSLLEFLSKNTKEEYPQKIFEIGYAVDKNGEHTKIALAVAENNSNFAYMKAIALEIAKKLNLNIEFEKVEHKSFIKGRVAKIVLGNKEIGIFGEINPEVLENFKIYIPVAVLEFNL